MQIQVLASPQPPDARLLQAEHREAHAEGDQPRAVVVERRRVLLVGRLRLPDQEEGDDRDRNVDPEDRPPGPLDEVAAGERADRGEAAGDGEEDRHRLATLADREGVEDDRQRRREHDRRAGALDDAEDDEPGLVEGGIGGGAAEGGGGGEDDDAEHDHAPVAGDVGEAAAEGEEGREREQVAVDDPLHARRREREVVLDRRHRDRDDRLVDEGHRDGEDHRRQDQFAVGGGRLVHAAPFAVRAAIPPPVRVFSPPQCLRSSGSDSESPPPSFSSAPSPARARARRASAPAPRSVPTSAS